MRRLSRITLPLLLLLCVGVAVADDTARIDQLIQQLGDASYKKREAAQAALRKLGPAAWPRIAAALKTARDLERRQRLQQLADGIRGGLVAGLFEVGASLPDSDKRSMAAFSRNGEQAIYFGRGKQGGLTFYRRALDSGEQTELLTLEGGNDEPLTSLLLYSGVSPDGAVAVMSRYKDDDGQRRYRSGLLTAEGKLRWLDAGAGLFYPILFTDEPGVLLVGRMTVEKGRPKMDGPFSLERLALASGKTRKLFDHQGGFPMHATYSADRKRLILLVAARPRRQNQLLIYDLAAGKKLATSPAFDWDDEVLDDNLLLVPDSAGQKVYVTAQVDRQSRIQVFDAATGKLADVTSEPLALCGMLDDRYLSAHSEKKRQACLVDTRTGRIIWQPEGKVVLIGRAGARALFARLREDRRRVRTRVGLSVGRVDRERLKLLSSLR